MRRLVIAPARRLVPNGGRTGDTLERFQRSLHVGALFIWCHSIVRPVIPGMKRDLMARRHGGAHMQRLVLCSAPDPTECRQRLAISQHLKQALSSARVIG